MQALANFVQGDVRYVAIELGIGGWQPHAAAEVFSHRYGDCKDKAALLSSMLHVIGVESYVMTINTERGGAAPDLPAAVNWFNHAILAIRLPDDVKDPSLRAVLQDGKLGRLLIFDPTDDLTPFGHIRGPLQANYGLLVAGEQSELLQLPTLAAESSGIHRSAKLTLAVNGTLSGEFSELRKGDSANYQRSMLKATTKNADRIKPIETLVSQSMATYQITKANIVNMNANSEMFGYNYSVVAPLYAKTAGNLLIVRPRVVGSKSSELLETKESRKFPVEFFGPSKDVDLFEITMPPGYVVDDLPPPVNLDYPFASYHSKTEVQGNVLRYSRTVEYKELSVPVDKIEDLKKFYRAIAGDERNNAVLKPAGS